VTVFGWSIGINSAIVEIVTGLNALVTTTDGIEDKLFVTKVNMTLLAFGEVVWTNGVAFILADTDWVIAHFFVDSTTKALAAFSGAVIFAVSVCPFAFAADL